jgi:hypothetical protein
MADFSKYPGVMKRFARLDAANEEEGARRSAAACSGVLPITELRLGMMARIIHTEYVAEYPNPVQIVMLERTQDGRENIAVAEAGVPGCVDGWKVDHLEIIPNAQGMASPGHAPKIDHTASSPSPWPPCSRKLDNLKR